MPIHNADIAAIFDEIADLLEIKGENPFRVRAYRNAARSLLNLGPDIKTLVAQGEDLTELPGIGKDLAGKITEIVQTGRCTALDQLHKSLPPSIAALLKIPGLGPKRVKALYDALNINSIEQLRAAARAGKLRDLRGFGEKTEAHILEALATQAGGARMKLALAVPYAEGFAAHLRGAPGVRHLEIAGSMRRMRETVGDVDIVAATDDADAMMRRVQNYDEVNQVLAHGPTRATVLLKCGLQVDVRVVAPESFGAALQYFTGSKAHNIVIRRIAQQKGLKVNEYGVFKGKRRVAGDTEESVYVIVGLPFIPPELRENRGEVEAARAGELPRLVTLADLRGDLHAHTKATDGHNTLAEMAHAARAHGFSYLAITEHSRRITMAHGFDPQRLRKQIDEIERLNKELEDITLLKGIEVDILEDGNLDLPDSVLRRLDLVVGAVHSHFDLPRARQTERILRAMDHPHFTVLAHPTGRLIDERPAYDVDMLRIIRKARDRGCFLELDAHPERLDLLDTHCQMAKDEGVLVSIASDAHSVGDFGHLRYGIGQARRGWLEAKDVLNTRTLEELRPLLRRTMSAAA